MGLSAPRLIFGVHSLTPYNRTTGEFYGTIKVLNSSSITSSQALVELTGGSSKFAWDAVEGINKAELNMKVKEYPDFLFQLFGGKAPTTVLADAAGTVTAMTNKTGTSLMNAVTGIASIAVKTAAKADLKFGKYVVKAASATTVDVYLSSDIDINRGNPATFQNDALKVTATPLTITAAGSIDLPNLGLTFTGGSGTIAMVVGDTATFEVKPPSSKNMEVVLGSSGTSLPEFGAIAIAFKPGDGSMFEVDCYRCKGSGLPMAMQENAYSEPDFKAVLLYDSARDGVMKVRAINPS